MLILITHLRRRYFCVAGTTERNPPSGKCPIGTTSLPQSSSIDQCFKTGDQIVSRRQPINVTAIPSSSELAMWAPNSSFIEFTLAPYCEVLFKIRLSQIPPYLQFDAHYTIAIYIDGSATAASLPQWFNDTDIDKHADTDFGLYAITETTFRVQIQLFNGRFISDMSSFDNSLMLDVIKPNRANYGTTDQFLVILEPNTDLDLPRNLPLQSQPYFLEFAGTYNQSYPFAAETLHERIDPRLYWTSSRQISVLSYFPYFSECKGYGSRIPIFAALENEACDLIPEEDTQPITAFTPWANQDRFADTCNLFISCAYEETIGSDEYWFQQSDSFFSFTTFPISQEEISLGDSFFTSFIGTSKQVSVDGNHVATK